MEIKIVPNYNTQDYINIPGIYTPFQNVGDQSEIYASVDIGVNKKVRVTQTGGNVFFGTVQSVLPIITYFTTIKRTSGTMLIANQIISIDEVLDNTASFYLDGTIEILLNYKIFDLKELKRSTPFTKTIDVPFTQNNDKIFTQVFNVNVDDGYNPKKRSNCQITDGGVLIVSGYIQVQEVDIPNKLYKCVFYGEFKNLFDDMGIKLIFGNQEPTDNLNFDDIIHNKFQSEIEASWIGDREYVYGFVQNGSINFSPTTGAPLSADNLYPYVRAKYVFDKIFSKYGYTYESEFLNSNLFYNVLSLPSIRKTNGTEVIKYSFDPLTGTYSIGTYSAIVSPPLDSQVIDIYGSSYNIPTYRFKIPYSSDNFKINYNINVKGYGGTASPGSQNQVFKPQRVTDKSIEVLLSIYRRGILVKGPDVIGSEIEDEANNPGGGWIYTAIENINAIVPINYNFLQGDEILLQLRVSSKNFNYVGVKKENGTLDDYPDFISIISSDYLQNLLPIFQGIKQSDFLGDIFKMFNLYIRQDKYNPYRFFIEPRDAFYESGKIIDYIDYDYESTNISYLTDVAAKNYMFSYSSGDDVANKQFQDQYPGRIYGDASIRLDNDFLNNEKKIQLISAPTILEKEFYNVYVPSVRNPSSSTDLKGFKNRFLFYTGLQGYINNNQPASRSITMKTGLTSSATLNYANFPAVDVFSEYRNKISPSLLFSNSSSSQIKEPSLYYTYYQNEIETYIEPLSHILTVDAYMNTNIFSRINFNDKFYFEVNGNAQYYILLSIENYNPAEKGMVRMKFLSYRIFKNRAKRDQYAIGDVAIDIGNGGIGQDLIGGGSDNIVTDNYKYQVLGENNIIDRGKKSVFIYGDNNYISSNNIVSYDSNATQSVSNTFNFGQFNPVLKEQSYTGVTATPGMIIYGGTGLLHMYGSDGYWYQIVANRVG
jgi:hypothetical protein